MLYRAIVAARTRAVWRRMDAHDFDAAVGMAAPDMHFRFVGDTPFGADVIGREQFAAWLQRTVAVFPNLRFTLEDAAVAGWPWNTRVAVRLTISATLADGTEYRNEAAQWIRLRWGRMIDDWVLEDNVALSAAHSVQTASV